MNSATSYLNFWKKELLLLKIINNIAYSLLFAFFISLFFDFSYLIKFFEWINKDDSTLSQLTKVALALYSFSMLWQIVVGAFFLFKDTDNKMRIWHLVIVGFTLGLIFTLGLYLLFFFAYIGLAWYYLLLSFVPANIFYIAAVKQSIYNQSNNEYLNQVENISIQNRENINIENRSFLLQMPIENTKTIASVDIIEDKDKYMIINRLKIEIKFLMIVYLLVYSFYFAFVKEDEDMISFILSATVVYLVLGIIAFYQLIRNIIDWFSFDKGNTWRLVHIVLILFNTAILFFSEYFPSFKDTLAPILLKYLIHIVILSYPFLLKISINKLALK